MRRLSIIGHRSAVLLGTAIATSLASDDSFPAGGAVGDIIQRLRDPFAGMEAGTTTYATIGPVPAQLALSGATIVRGSAEAIPGTAYAIGIVASSGDGKRSTMATITLMALGRAADGPVAVKSGPVILALAGSSSPERYSYEGSVTANDRIRMFDTASGTFKTLGAGVFCAKVGEALLATLDRGLDVIPAGIGGSTLAGWVNDASYVQRLADRIAQAGGKCEYVLLQVGGNDVTNAMVTSIPEQMAKIRQLIGTIRTRTGLPNLKVIINPTQDYPGNPAGLSMQRQAETRVATTDAGVYYGISVYDIPTSDGVHQVSPAGYTLSGTRFGKRLAALVAGQADQRGPFVSAATPVSPTQTDLTITHRLGTDFTPVTGMTGFLLYDSTGAALAVSTAERISATTIRLTHAARTAGDAGTVLYMPNGGNTDDSTIVRDNTATAWPLESSGVPIALAAASGGGSGGSGGGGGGGSGGTTNYTATGKSAQIHYRPDGNAAVNGWNNRTLSAIQTATALVDPSGAATGWSERETSGVLLSIGSSASGSSGANTGNNSGIYPDAVMSGYLSPATNGTVVQALSGLDDSKAYDVTLFGSRATSGRSTLFTVGNASQTLDVSNSAGETANAGNTRTTVTFAKVRPTNGVINIGWALGTVNGVKSTFAYLGAMVVTEYVIG